MEAIDEDAGVVLDWWSGARGGLGGGGGGGGGGESCRGGCESQKPDLVTGGIKNAEVSAVQPESVPGAAGIRTL